MRNRALDARTYTFRPTDVLLPDANFWLYLYAPQPVRTRWAVQAYSRIYRALIAANAQLHLDVLVLSEFINSFARREWEIKAPLGQDFKRQDFKPFRKSPAFLPISQAIAMHAKSIVGSCKTLDHPFSTWPLDQILDEFGKGQSDYNDQLIAETCRKHGLALLTNDSDFTEGGLTVFTANNWLLNACPP